MARRKGLGLPTERHNENAARAWEIYRSSLKKVQSRGKDAGTCKDQLQTLTVAYRALERWVTENEAGSNKFSSMPQYAILNSERDRLAKRCLR